MSTVLVCGGRNFGMKWDSGRMIFIINQEERDLLFRVLTNLHAQCEFTKLIHGAARGADTLAEHWALAHGIAVRPYPADWQSFGRRAGFMRNEQMFTDGKPELVVAFKGNSGTHNMIAIARQGGCRVITPGWKD